MKGIIMMRAKYLFIVTVVLSAIIMFTSCQEEPTSVGPDQSAGQLNLNNFVLPPGATFVSATFNIHLWQWAGQGTQIKDVNLHRITSPWQEMVVNWNNFGGTYAPEIDGSFNAAAFKVSIFAASTLTAISAIIN